MNQQKRIHFFLIIRSLEQHWTENSIRHLKSWITHCYLHREHRLRRPLPMPESEKTLWVLMTTVCISLFSLSLRKMQRKVRKMSLWRWLKTFLEIRWRMASTRKRCWQESTTTNSDTEKLILEIIQKDLCMDSKSWIAGFMMKTSRLSILRR